MAKEYCDESTQFFLIGNKVDLDPQREISVATATDFCTDMKMSAFAETSAKTGENVKDVLERIANDAGVPGVIVADRTYENPPPAESSSSCC
jgi:GTPase SAR1 family protein